MTLLLTILKEASITAGSSDRRLNSTTATDPSDSGRAQISSVCLEFYGKKHNDKVSFHTEKKMNE